MVKIQSGETKRIINRYMLNNLFLVVPSFVNSVLTNFSGTYHPNSRQVKNEPIGSKILAVRKSQQLRNDFPKSDNSGTAPHDNAQRVAIVQQTIVVIHAAFLLDI